MLRSEMLQKTGPFNDKKLDVMVDVFARSVLVGKNLGFPETRDSLVGSEVRWATLNHAMANLPRIRGTAEEMQEILEYGRNLTEGSGLPVKNHELREGTLVSN